MTRLGKILGNYYAATGESQAEFARRSKAHAPTLTQIKKNGLVPTAEQLEKIILGLPKEWQTKALLAHLGDYLPESLDGLIQFVPVENGRTGKPTNLPADPFEMTCSDIRAALNSDEIVRNMFNSLRLYLDKTH